MKHNIHSRWRRFCGRMLSGSIVCGSLLSSGWHTSAQARALRVGDKLPIFNFKTIDGRTFSSATIRNRPLWITFFMST
ncbi:MAG: hypothetical protein JO316_06215 [Abitibacteriaceae bacterium]|nr:hypothetical protein [Abditibacteriaceae bacterium]MBV9864925.1 hypothetical protein [Abditibacteriaceae bacterium]